MSRLRSYVSQHHLALLALFVALGGTSYAAIKLPANSVGSKQLKTHAVTPSKVAASTIARFRTTIRLTARSDSSGIPMSCTPSSPFWFCTAPQATTVAHCQPGERATGGSYAIPSQWQGGATTHDTGPYPSSGTPTGWFVTASYLNPYASTSASHLPITIHVVCVT
jgi:hypothetical protein